MKRLRTIALGAVLGAFLGACATPGAEVTLYSLQASTGPARAPDGFAGSLVVGPSTLPELVDRTQLVTRDSEHRVLAHEQHRWAEPLRAAVPRVLAEAIGAALGTTRNSAYPQNVHAQADYRVHLDILRFDMGPGAAARIEAAWKVTHPASGRSRVGRSQLPEPAASTTFEARVAALDRALVKLAHEIAGVIRALDAGR